MGATIRDGWLHGSLEDDKGREWPILRFPESSSRGPLAAVTPNLILHTTETFNPRLRDDGYVEDLRFPSQWQCGNGVIGQHIRDGLSGDAVTTWDRFAQQIEMVADSQLGLWLPIEDTLGPTVALTAWLHRTRRIKTGLKRPSGQSWPVVLDRGPQAVTSYYRRHAGLWPNTPGVYGHVDIPNNHHWDPGSFNYPAFFRRVRAAIAVQEGDDDMTKEQLRKLTKAYNFFLAASEELGTDHAMSVGRRTGRTVKAVEATSDTPAGHCPADCSCRSELASLRGEYDDHKHNEGNTSPPVVPEA